MRIIEKNKMNGVVVHNKLSPAARYRRFFGVRVMIAYHNIEKRIF